MEHKKQNKSKYAQKNPTNPGMESILSSTEMTGMIPSIPEGNYEAYDDMYSVPTSGVELPDEEYSQSQKPQ